MAQKKGAGMLFAALQSVASVTIGFAIAELGRVSVAKELLFFSASIVILACALLVFYKNKLGGNINPSITNPKVRAFLLRYPLFPVGVGMLMGVAVMITAIRLLDA